MRSYSIFKKNEVVFYLKFVRSYSIITKNRSYSIFYLVWLKQNWGHLPFSKNIELGSWVKIRLHIQNQLLGLPRTKLRSSSIWKKFEVLFYLQNLRSSSMFKNIKSFCGGGVGCLGSTVLCGHTNFRLKLGCDKKRVEAEICQAQFKLMHCLHSYPTSITLLVWFALELNFIYLPGCVGGWVGGWLKLKIQLTQPAKALTLIK